MKLHWQILLGIAFGLIYGLAVRAGAPIEAWETWAAFPALLGDLFIRALKMIIIPLIVASVVMGIQEIGDTARLGKVGVRTMLYYGATTLLAVTAGMLVVNVLEPGVGLELTFEGEAAVEPTPLTQVIRDIIPTSALGVFAANKMLPSIFVALLIGVGLLALDDEQAAPMRGFFSSLNALVLEITDWIMRTAPVGVAALFIKTLLDPKLADVGQYFEDLGTYMLAVVAGLGIHALITLPLILWLVGKRSPLAYARALSPALLTAFSTASSSATYPVTLEQVTEEAGVSRETATFVLPLGATINMDGTALYEAVAVVFIANALAGFDLTFVQQLTVVVTATLAAIGAAGVPSAGLVTMIIVLESVGLPAGAYGLVVAVDRVLDMCRTTVNVWGDAVGAAVVDRWSTDEA